MIWRVGIASLLCCSALGAHDLTRLPLGDGKISDAPKIGYVFACRPPTLRPALPPQGAHAAGPWIDAHTQTYDFTRKTVVDGAIRWPSRFHVGIQGDERVLRGNDLPAHATGGFPIDQTDDAYQTDRNPNAIQAQNFELRLPVKPRLAATPSCLPMGPIGYMDSGAVIFNALDLAGLDAVAHEAQDACQGHPELGGSYHYHSLSFCAEAALTSTAHSKRLGYALDGFGIYGRFGEQGKPMRNPDLDACHGHTHAMDGLQTYHYHATLEYPYTLSCFAGTPARIEGFKPLAPPTGPPRWHLLVFAAGLGLVAGALLRLIRTRLRREKSE